MTMPNIMLQLLNVNNVCSCYVRYNGFDENYYRIVKIVSINCSPSVTCSR